MCLAVGTAAPPGSARPPGAPPCARMSLGEKARTPLLCLAAGQPSRGRWALSRGPVRGRHRSQPPEGRHRGTAGLGTVEAGDGEQWAAGRWAEAEDGHRARVEGPSLKEARRPSSREGQAAFRAAGRVGCSHCARGPEHRPTPDAASATAHDGGAAGSGGRGPLSAPPSPVTADSASWAGFAGGHEAPLVRAGSALGPTRSRVQDRKLGPGGPEGHGHRFNFASSGLSAGSCRRGTQARGAASWAGRPVL